MAFCDLSLFRAPCQRWDTLVFCISPRCDFSTFALSGKQPHPKQKPF
ncbi:unnamed protein product [Heterosigma akashiwo]